MILLIAAAEAIPDRLAEPEELDAPAGALQQGTHLFQFADGAHAVQERLLAELDHEAANDEAVGWQVGGDPVVRQARAGQHEMAGLEVPHVVADEGAAAGSDDQLELVFVVAVPALQRRGTAVLHAAHEVGRVRRLAAEPRIPDEIVLELGGELGAVAAHRRHGSFGVTASADAFLACNDTQGRRTG